MSSEISILLLDSDQQLGDEKLSAQMVKYLSDPDQSSTTKPQFLDLSAMKTYYKPTGLKLQIVSAHGIDAKEMYANVCVFVIHGKSSNDVLIDKFTGHEQEVFVTSSHDYEALLNSPKWTDPPRILNPDFNRSSKLVFLVLGIDPPLKIDQVTDKDEEKSGKVLVTVRGEDDIMLTSKNFLGWTVVDLFKGKTFVDVLPFFTL